MGFRQFSLPLPLAAVAAVALLAGTALAADCTKVIRASGGDTCASVTQQYGISVNQFINYNPSLTTCTLSAGVSYCVSQDPADAPVITYTPTGVSGPQPTGGLIPSPNGSDGVCGGGTGYTCLGSVYGDCCSQNGYCGNEAAYCGEGCKAEFGMCDGGMEEPGPGGPVTVTVTVTLPHSTTTAAKTSSVGTTTFRVSTRPSTTTTRTTTTTRRTTTTTRTTTTPSQPSPTLSGNRNCNKFHKIAPQDTCQRLARAYDVTTLQIEIWNPRFDCRDVSDYEGYTICVGERACLLGLICLGD